MIQAWTHEIQVSSKDMFNKKKETKENTYVHSCTHIHNMLPTPFLVGRTPSHVEDVRVYVCLARRLSTFRLLSFVHKT